MKKSQEYQAYQACPLLADKLPLIGWRRDRKGYYRWDRRTDPRVKKGEYLHRATLIALGLSREQMVGTHVHHMARLHGNSTSCGLANCPYNLMISPPAFNPTSARQDPYTGRMMSREEWERRYGG